MFDHIEVFAALAAPFDRDEVRTRNQSGRDLTYVTARTVMNRLDEVLGPGGWWDEYRPIGDRAVICRLTIVLPGGSRLTKEDCGGFADTHDDSDAEKAGFSDALKRAAVKFGVGRYLHGDGVPPSIVAHRAEERAAALVRTELDRAEERAAAPPPVSGGGPAETPAPRRGDIPGPVPKSGKALFAWIKDRDEKLGSDVLGAVTRWGKDHGYPPRMVQWDALQVDFGHTEALRLYAGLNR